MKCSWIYFHFHHIGYLAILSTMLISCAGSPFSTQGVATRFVARDGNNMTSPMEVKRISSNEVIPSPEQISSITACSDADLRSDGELFESGATFSSSFTCVSQPSAESHIMLHDIDRSKIFRVLKKIIYDFIHELFPKHLAQNGSLYYTYQ
jgi:hypothetical protein